MKQLLITIAAVLLVGCGPKEEEASIQEAAEEMNGEKLDQMYLGQAINIKVKDDNKSGDLSLKHLMACSIPLFFIYLLFSILLGHDRLKKLKTASILAGIICIAGALIGLSKGDLGWVETTDGRGMLPASIVCLFLGPFFLYIGITGRWLVKDD